MSDRKSQSQRLIKDATESPIDVNIEAEGTLRHVPAERESSDNTTDEATQLFQCKLNTGATLDDGPVGTEITSLESTENGRRSHVPSAAISQVRHFGDYELIVEIARGGMGVVYKARQLRLNRIVALKMILAGQLASEQDVRRFYTEAESAANLNHPGIVPIFEIGQIEGQHYFSMAFIEGESLAQRVSEGPLPPREAAEMLMKICNAIAFAHEHGVIHRDLKPANILIDASGEPKVTDFGLAKKMGDDSALTGTGQILGTPSYMAPEQGAGKTDEVGPLSDIYAIGAILYYSLLGRPPFLAANPLDTILQSLNSDPIPPRNVNPAIPVDLETICLKCLEKEPRRRYASASEIERELSRWLHGKPILARPISRMERLAKLVRRHPVVSGLLLAVFVTLFVSSAVSTWFGIQSKNAATALLYAKEDADNKRISAERLANENALLATAERRAKESLQRISKRLLFEKGVTELEKGRITEGLYTLTSAVELPGNDFDDVIRANLALWEAALHRPRFAVPLEWAITQVSQPSPDGRIALLLHKNRTPLKEYRFWDLNALKPVGEALVVSDQRLGNDIFPKERMDAAAWNDDLTMLYASVGGNSIRQYDIGSKQVIGERVKLKTDKKSSPSTVDQLVISPDSEMLLAASRTGRTAWLVDAESLQVVGSPLATKGWISCIAFTSDSRLALLGTGGGEGFTDSGDVTFWNARTGEPVGKRLTHPGKIMSIDVSPDGALLAVGGSDGTTRLWDLTKFEATNVRLQHNAPVTRVLFSPLDALLVTADADGTIALFNPKNGEPAGQLPTRERVSSLAFSSDGTQLLTGHLNGDLKGWLVGRGWQPDVTLKIPGGASRVTFDEAPDKLHVAFNNMEEGAGVYSLDVRDSKELSPIRRIGKPHAVSIISPDLKRAVSWQPTTPDGETNFNHDIELTDISTGTSMSIHLGGMSAARPGALSLLNSLHVLYFAQFSADSRFLVTAAMPIATANGRVWILDAETGAVITDAFSFVNPSVPARLEDDIRLPIFRFDALNNRLLCADLRGATVLDLATGQRIFSSPKLDGIIKDAALTQDGGVIAIAIGKTVSLIEGIGQTDGDVSPRTRGLDHDSTVRNVLFSPSGRYLFTVGDDRVVRMWNVATGSMEGEPFEHSDRITLICCNADESLLAVACGPKVVLWDIETRKRMGPVIHHPDSVAMFDFSPSGTQLIAFGGDGSCLRLWKVDTRSKLSATELRRHIKSLSGRDDTN